MELTNITSDIVCQIKNVIEEARHKVAVTVNHELLRSYWQVGKLISGGSQTNSIYGVSERSFMVTLSKVLTNELGKGFSRPNLINMKKFYESYPRGCVKSNNFWHSFFNSTNRNKY